MEPMTKIVIHYVLVLIMNQIQVEINESSFCWGHTRTPLWTTGGSPCPALRTSNSPSCFINKIFQFVNKYSTPDWFKGSLADISVVLVAGCWTPFLNQR